jgi:hypothetical protein
MEYNGKLIACNSCGHAFRPELPIESRDRVADLEGALRQAAAGHAAALAEARAQWEAERQALRADWEERQAALAAGHQRELAKAEARLAEERRRWEERDAAARQQIAAARAEAERAGAEWETRHQAAVAGHEQRLNEERAQAAAALRRWEERHAEAERRGEQERAALQAELGRVRAEAEAYCRAKTQDYEQALEAERSRGEDLQREWQARHASAERQSEAERSALRSQAERLRSEAEAVRQDRDRYAAQRDEALATRQEAARRAETEIARLREEVERLGQVAEGAARREQELADRLSAIQSGQQQALAASRGELEAARAEAVAEREARRGEADALRGERDGLAARSEAAEANAAGLAEQLRAAQQDAERRRDELSALHNDLEAARADAAAARERAAQAAEEQARLAAMHEGWQQRDEAMRRADTLAAEREARGATRQGPGGAADVDRAGQGAAAMGASREAAPVERAGRPAVAPAVEAERTERGQGQEPLTATHRRHQGERTLAQAPTPRTPQKLSAPAPEAEADGGDQGPSGRMGPRLWVCLPLALFLWVASLPAGAPVMTRDGALTLLFALTLLLQFHLWDELEGTDDGGPHSPAPGPSFGPRQLMLAMAVAWNVAYLTFSGSGLLLGAYAALSVASLFLSKGLLGQWPGPLARSQVSLLRYPALVYLLAAPTSVLPKGPLLSTLALVYLCFSAFALLHEGRLRAARGSAGMLALAIVLMLAVAAQMAVVLGEHGGSAWMVQCALTGLGAGVLLYVYWRRGAGRAARAGDYLVFVVGFAWMVNFAFDGREFAIPWIPGSR